MTDESKLAALLPCPFCGAEPTSSDSGITAGCLECDFELRFNEWNNRTVDPRNAELVEALRELHDFSEQSYNFRRVDRSLKAFKRAAELLNKYETKEGEK